MFSAGTGTWSAGASCCSRLFHGGELRYKRRAAVADLEHAAAKYRQTVLAAMQDVADTLRALETDARTLRAQVDAERAASDAFEIAKKQFRVGGVSYVTVLIAAAFVSRGAPEPRAGPGGPLFRFRGIVPGARRRLVESQRSRGSQQVSSILSDDRGA